MGGITLDKSIREVVNEPENGCPEARGQDAPLHHLLHLLTADVRHGARSIEVVSAQARSVYSRATGKAKFLAIKTCFSVKSLFFELKVCFSFVFLR